MTVMNPFDDVPTDATLKLLSQIHDLQVNSNELIGTIQAFRMGQLRLDGVQIIRLIDSCRVQLHAQNQVLVSLVEKQLTLDDQLKAMVNNMDKEN